MDKTRPSDVAPKFLFVCFFFSSLFSAPEGMSPRIPCPMRRRSGSASYDLPRDAPMRCGEAPPKLRRTRSDAGGLLDPFRWVMSCRTAGEG